MGKWVYSIFSFAYAIGLINRWALDDGAGILMFSFATTVCAVLAWIEWRK